MSKEPEHDRQTTIVLSHISALQAARSVAEAKAKAPFTEIPLPSRPPSERELTQRMLELQEAKGTRTKPPFHVLIGSSAACRRSSIRVSHSLKAELPRRSLLKLDDHTSFTTPNLSLSCMAAQCPDLISLLLLLWEACGTYETETTGVSNAFEKRPLTTPRSLRFFCENYSSLPGARKISRALRYTAGNSASIRETQFALLLGLPLMYGGYGLGIPTMNHKVIASEEAFAISSRRSFRCDLCWPEHKLDVEFQSRLSHEGETMRLKDSRRTNALISMGWKVVSATDGELASSISTDVIAGTIRRALGKRSQPVTDELYFRRHLLMKKLGLARV